MTDIKSNGRYTLGIIDADSIIKDKCQKAAHDLYGKNYRYLLTIVFRENYP